jgi:hypothetical protein
METGKNTMRSTILLCSTTDVLLPVTAFGPSLMWSAPVSSLEERRIVPNSTGQSRTTFGIVRYLVGYN